MTIISRCAPPVLVIVSVHDVCCHIFGVGNNRLIGYPFWEIMFGILGWVPTRTISLWLTVPLDMAILDTLVTYHVLPDRWWADDLVRQQDRCWWMGRRDRSGLPPLEGHRMEEGGGGSG